MNEPGVQVLMDQETIARRVEDGDNAPAECPIRVSRDHPKGPVVIGE